MFSQHASRRPKLASSWQSHIKRSAITGHLLKFIALGFGLSGCFEWEYEVNTNIHAFGEVRDLNGKVLPNVEVRLVKYWPIEGRAAIEPPPSVLVSDNPTAPEGAAYGVELVAVAQTNNNGIYDMILPGEAIADPRHDPNELGHIVTARTILVVPTPEERPELSAALSYTFRYGGRYRHHCELFDLTSVEARADFTDTSTTGEVQVSFARGDLGPLRRARDPYFVHELQVAPSDGSVAPLFVSCEESDGELLGCDLDPSDANRLVVRLRTNELSTAFAKVAAGLEASITTSGPFHRSFAPVDTSGDPTFGGVTPPPAEPPSLDPQPGPTPPPDSDPIDIPPVDVEPDPTDPVEPPIKPRPIPPFGIWAIGPQAQIPLVGTPAVDGDPTTQFIPDPAFGPVNSVYIQLGDVRLTEAGLLNTFAENASTGCLLIQLTPSVYRTLEGALQAQDWTEGTLLCGTAGPSSTLNSTQRFDTEEVDGQRAGWLRILPLNDDAIELTAIGEFVAFGRTF